MPLPSKPKRKGRWDPSWNWLKRGVVGAAALWLGGWAQAGLGLARGQGCGGDPPTWAAGLTEQLPLFLNLALSRSRSEFQVVLVGKPEVEPLSGVPFSEGFRLYFTTLERRLVVDPLWAEKSWAGRRTESIQLAYEADVFRSSPADPWQLVRLRVTGPGVAIRDVTNGLTAQAIRSWQRAGCPLPDDLDLTKPP